MCESNFVFACNLGRASALLIAIQLCVGGHANQCAHSM